MNNEARTVVQQGVKYTAHALRRMQQRALSAGMIELAMLYGREVLSIRTILYVVGRAEVRAARVRDGVRIEHLEGIHVVCAGSGAVKTVYRNRSLRGLRALKHTPWAPTA